MRLEKTEKGVGEGLRGEKHTGFHTPVIVTRVPASRQSVTRDEILKPIRQLYAAAARFTSRETIAYIAFTRKTRDGVFENLFSLTLTELEHEFDRVAPWLASDAYFSVNGMYRPAHFPHQPTGLPGVCRGEDYLRYLNACYVDLDVGRKSGSAAQCLALDEAAQELRVMIENGSLPNPSMSARSGRGLYLFWFLRGDNDPNAPPRAFSEKLIVYKRLQRAIVKQLRPLAADPQAIDAARLLRVPGTLHSISGQPALYRIRKDGPNPSPPTYTLHQLADAFKVSTVTHEKDGLRSESRRSGGVWDYGRRTVQRGSAPKRERGPRTRDERRAEDLLLIEQHRGGWPKGCRLKQLRLYASFLKGAGVQLQAADAAVKRMARNCKPPYPSDHNDTPLKKIAPGAFREALTVPTTDTLCEWLEVTPELARELNLQSIVPAAVRHERMPPVGGQRAINRETRRIAIREFVAQHGLQSCRTIARALQDQGLSVSAWTVNNDLKELRHDVAIPQRSPARSPGESH